MTFLSETSSKSQPPLFTPDELAELRGKFAAFYLPRSFVFILCIFGGIIGAGWLVHSSFTHTAFENLTAGVTAPNGDAAARTRYYDAAWKSLESYFQFRRFETTTKPAAYNAYNGTLIPQDCFRVIWYKLHDGNPQIFIRVEQEKPDSEIVIHLWWRGKGYSSLIEATKADVDALHQSFCSWCIQYEKNHQLVE